ncbi:MAG: sigma-70 family RNA polymerase sigma factor [Roseivirga sp.]
MTTSGNQGTITQWVHDYGDHLYSWASYKLKDKALAEDIVQETFLSAFSALDTFQKKSSPKTWLTSILNRKIIDQYRKMAKRSEQSMSADTQATFDTTEQFFDRNDRWRANGLEPMWEQDEQLLDDTDFNSVFEICMKDLPPVWYTSMTSKYILEKSAVDTCQELGITTSNYWQIIHRAKLLMKKCLDTKWFETR